MSRPLPTFLAATVVALGLSEATIRVASGGAGPRLALYAEEAGRIELLRGAEAALRHPTGRVTRVHTDADGLRAGGRRGGWLAVGDSQVLGQGVEDEETFAARASAAGMAVANAGVAGHGVEDALDRAARLAPEVGATGVLVVVNQLNDWDEAGHLAADRLAVRGGYLVSRERAGSWPARALASPLGRSHLVLTALAVLVAPPLAALPAGLGDPAAAAPATTRIAAAVRTFADAHPALRTVAVLLPADVDVVPARGERSAAWDPALRPGRWAPLRDALLAALGDVRAVDLAPSLAGRPSCFLDRDTHLSPDGHAAVAARLAAELQ